MAEIDTGELPNYASVAADYRTRWMGEVQKEERWFGSSCKTLDQAIRRACASEIPNLRGKPVRHSHQQRIPPSVLAEAGSALANRHSELEQTKTFLELFEIVDSTIGAIPGVGELLVYDVAHRLGCYLSLMPEELFLHRGARWGAKALGLSTNRRSIPISEFPKGLQALNGAQLEDVLCIYRAALARLHESGESELTASPQSSCFAKAARPRRPYRC